MESQDYELNNEILEYVIDEDRIYDIARIGVSLLTYEY